MITTLAFLPLLALAAPAGIKSWVLLQAVQLLLPLIGGAITPVIMAVIKLYATRVGKLPAMVQRAIVVLVAGLVNAGGTMIGVQLVDDPTLWSSTDINAILSAAIAFAIHASEKQKQAKADLAAVRAEALRAMNGQNPFAIPDGLEPLPTTR